MIMQSFEKSILLLPIDDTNILRLNDNNSIEFLCHAWTMFVLLHLASHLIRLGTTMPLNTSSRLDNWDYGLTFG